MVEGTGTAPGQQDIAPLTANMAKLLAVIEECLSGTNLADIGQQDHTQIMETILKFPLTKADWEGFAFFDKTTYTRNLIADGGERYQIILMCWNFGQQSMIHDHSNSHCIMRVLEGEIQETRYQPPSTPENFDGDLRITQIIRLDPSHEPPGLYIHDSIGWHRVGNPNSSRRCVSLHLYSPPILAYHGVGESGRLQSFKKTTFYSVRGKRVTKPS